MKKQSRTYLVELEINGVVTEKIYASYLSIDFEVKRLSTYARNKIKEPWAVFVRRGASFYCSNTKIDLSEHENIKYMHQHGYSTLVIARKYKVGMTTIYKI